VSPWKFGAATVILLVVTTGVAVLAARIYARSILRMGARVSWRRALAR
jgi:ABC-2 type transport system permease protein